MATSGKNNKSPKAASSSAAKGTKKAAATTPVVPSEPVAATDPVVSRIPPSIPIDSALVGEATKPIAAASARGTETAPVTKAGSVPAVPASAKPEAKAAEKPAEKPAPPAAKAPPPQTTVIRKGGFWPMALGGVVAAGLGAGAAIWAGPQLMPPPEPAPATEIDTAAIRSEAVEAATAAGAEAGAAAGGEAAAKAIAELPAPAAAAEAGDTAPLQAELEAQAQKIAALEAALAARPAAASADTAPSADATADSGATTQLTEQIASLRDALATQAGQIADLTARPQVDAQAIAELQALAQNAAHVKAEIESAAAAAQQSLDTVQSEAQAATQRAQAVASVAALGAALEHGNSAGEAVQQLQDAGIEVPEPLAQEDLPTLVQIQMGFDAVARSALTVSLKAESREGGAMTAVGNFLRVQTGARSVEPREGADPDAILSRAGALVDQGEIASALEEIATLPPEGQEAMANWMAQAKAYIDAEAALNDVATTLN